MPDGPLENGYVQATNLNFSKSCGPKGLALDVDVFELFISFLTSPKGYRSWEEPLMLQILTSNLVSGSNELSFRLGCEVGTSKVIAIMCIFESLYHSRAHHKLGDSKVVVPAAVAKGTSDQILHSRLSSLRYIKVTYEPAESLECLNQRLLGQDISLIIDLYKYTHIYRYRFFLRFACLRHQAKRLASRRYSDRPSCKWRHCFNRL